MKVLAFDKKQLEFKKNLVEEVKQEFEKVRKKLEIDKGYAKPIKFKLAEKICSFSLKRSNKESIKLINSYNEFYIEANSKKFQKSIEQGKNVPINYLLESCTALCKIYKEGIFEEIQDFRNYESGGYLCLINVIEHAVNEFEKQLDEYFQKDIKKIELKIKEREQILGSELCL